MRNEASSEGAEIHSLHGLAPPNVGRPVADVVTFIQRLLEEAERGEITAIGVTKVDGAGAPLTCWEGGTADRNILQAGATYLMVRMANARSEVL